MEFKKAMEIMRLICRCVDIDCDECPLFLDGKCSVRPWADSDVVRVEGILEKWEKTHPEPQYPTWGDWLAEMGVINWEDNGDGDGVYSVMVPTFKMCNQIPADIAEKLGLKPKEAANNAGH